MEYRSLAISFRIQLGFHAANNEGAGGTNVMEPRRITVGDKEYDGISGEIIRRHILEHFVKLCQANGVSLHSRCNGLVPDRCKAEVKQWMNKQKVTKLEPDKHYVPLMQEILSRCPLCDVGGYLVALQRQQDSVEGTLKRDSCFEVGWLITEHPAVVDYTQHSAYDPDPEKHNLFVQNMRTGIYGGVLRLDLDRIGFNDWWWLNEEAEQQGEEAKQQGEEAEQQGEEAKQQGEEAEQQEKEAKQQKQGVGYAICEEERKKRIRLLLQAIRHWLMSPSFAKQAGWLQHMSGLLEGVIVLSKDGPAPFYSPIRFELEGGDPNKPSIKPNDKYRELLDKVKEQCGDMLEVYRFDSPEQLKQRFLEIEAKFATT